MGLSESACFNRVRRLEQRKILQRYSAHIDQRALGSTVTVLVSVILDSHKQHELTRFEQVVGAMPEVVECNYVAGQFDYLLKVVAKDTDDFARIHRQHLARDAPRAYARVDPDARTRRPNRPKRAGLH